ncbi:MAG: FAD-dependent monooxygenase [Cohaesibacteraceae bacterium]|nr:FAD-dependent monooxygenase [Cohaesibacteraceae bacterium]
MTSKKTRSHTGSTPILIVGAGPVGLTAAIELSRRGHKIRIIDKEQGPPEQSRAIAINARTLEILEPCGATPRLIKEGIQVQCANMYALSKKLMTIDFNRLDHRYNFLTALPQTRTEEILAETLLQYDMEPEWQTGLDSVVQEAKANGDFGTITCVLQGPDGQRETITPDIVIGADGAHSTVRKDMGIGFKGESYPHDWSLADVRLSGDVEGQQTGAYLDKGTMCGVIPLGKGRHRIISNQPDVFKVLPETLKVEEVFWETLFRVSHRQVETYQKGNVFLAGDAAHIHSPAGGRGMNLGIEDAATLAFLIDKKDTARYNDMRWPIGNAVLKATEQQTRMVSSKSRLPVLFMRYIAPLIMKTPLAVRNMREMMGLAAPHPEWL